MKNETKPDPQDDDLRNEYEFDYTQAKANRFAAGLKSGGRLVLLEPEVARSFSESATVNAVPKALLQTMPPPINP